MNFQLLDFPPVPQEIQEECLHSIKFSPPLIKLSYGDKDFANSKWDIRSSSHENHLGFEKSEEIYDYIQSRNDNFVEFSIHPTPKSLNDWFAENGQDRINQLYKISRISLFVIQNGEVGYPHIDPSPMVINFMIETSSDNVITKFWKVKPEFADKKIYTLNVYPFEKLDYVDEVVVPKNSWVMLKVSNLHSIENLNPEKPRVIIQVEVTPRDSA